jgi:hypothetical protein
LRPSNRQGETIMNTQVNIKARRLLFSPTFVTLSVVVVVLLAFGGSSVQGQTTAAPIVDSSITIATSGTVTDTGTVVQVSGSVTIKCRQVIDTTTTTATRLVMLDFDFSQLKGTTGSGKTLKTFVTGDNHATELRPFQASDTIVVTVPYFDQTKDALSASSFMATANLSFDVSTGKLTGGSLSYGNNIFTSTGVGTFTVN